MNYFEKTNCRGFSILKFLLGTITILLLLVISFLLFFLSPTAQWAVQKYLPEVLGTEVKVDNVHLSLLRGELLIENLRVADPSDAAKHPDMLSLGNLHVLLSLRSLLGDHLIIERVSLSDTTVFIHQDEDGVFSFEKLALFDDDKTEEEEPKEGDGMALLIKEVIINNLGFEFRDDSVTGQSTRMVMEKFNFKGDKISINPGGVADLLEKGIHITQLEFSDAALYYAIAPVDNGEHAEEKVKDESEKKVAIDTTEEPLSTTEEIAKKRDETLELEKAVDPIQVQKLDIRNFSFTFQDDVRQGNPLYVIIKEIYLDLGNFAMHTTPDDSGVEWESTVLQAGFQVEQGKDAPTAYLDAFAKLDMAGTGIPTTTGILRLTGFEFETIRPLIPQGTQTAVGGSGFDLSANWAVAEELLNVGIILQSNRGTRTVATIGGTPANPQFSGSELLLNLAGRPVQFISGLTGDAFDGGLQLITGVTDTAGQLARGAGRSVMGFGSGLLNTGRGLLTGDLEEMEKGLRQATVGTVSNVAGTVTDTTGSARDTVGKTADSGRGETRTRTWRETVSDRHDLFLVEGKKWMKESPFPPETKPAKDGQAPDVHEALEEAEKILEETDK